MTTKKRQKLRNNEYYDTQEMFDDLYNKAKNKKNYKFYKLMDLITSKQNVELAYRNIKNNAGSKTYGTNLRTIDDLANQPNDRLVQYVRNRLQNYHPHEVRRIEIPKANGKIRPLGIPTIEDRLIQQCILQILEPICEAKFYKHNYGFRPNRSTHHAMERTMFLVNHSKLHYVIDIDIKGFFDNVCHEKLLKQMWSLGIQDKQLLCVIGKMLRAPIKGIGIPTKGTPQGGILSPLLSNIVLNELDWWVANQWEYFQTRHQYSYLNKYNALKKTKMKEMYIVRYADDFKIFCRSYQVAKKMFYATKMWLKERLKLEMSQEKSKIINLNKAYSNYLGFKMKLRDKGKGKVIKSFISDKSKENIQIKLKAQIERISKNPTINNVNRYNAMVLGIHNYYRIATHVSLDCANIAFVINRCIYNRTKNVQSKSGIKSESFKCYYGAYNYKTVYIKGIALFPIKAVATKPSNKFSQDICKYTVEGRRKIHKNQQSVSVHILRYIMEHPISKETVEYNDNRISLYVGQNGVCPISKEPLQIGNMECHHKIPKIKGGTDKYQNLILLKTEVHKLIHANTTDIIDKYMQILTPNESKLKKINKLRTLVGNFEIKI